jgi:ABC-2 type transport system permease protein
MSTLTNIAAVARREFTVRVQTRSFMFGTLLLVIGVVVIALLPVIIQYVDRSDATKVAVVVTADDVAGDPVPTLSALLNATTTGEPDPDEEPDFIVERVAALEAGRSDVLAGRYGALLGIGRAAGGELEFTLYTNDRAEGRMPALIRQASNAIAVSDRLDRLGVEPSDRATLFAPAEFGLAWPDAARTDPIKDSVASVGQDMLAFGMTVLIFMIIIMYGNWIAMSVVEEKSSRVMEVVLNAATPFQLMAGKVFGVGAVAFTQYAAIVVSGGVVLALQGQIASIVLGDSGGSLSLPEGLTLGLLLFFGVYGVLGFLMYACLYAAAGSLVSRMEDVNAAVMPMTLVSTVGYMVAIYAATGLLDAEAPWLVALGQVPFVSPFMMLGRIATGVAQPWEVAVSIVLLVGSIFAALWLASRIYRAGVLLYGQRPGVRAVWRIVRAGV